MSGRKVKRGQVNCGAAYRQTWDGQQLTCPHLWSLQLFLEEDQSCKSSGLTEWKMTCERRLPDYPPNKASNFAPVEGIRPLTFRKDECRPASHGIHVRKDDERGDMSERRRHQETLRGSRIRTLGC